MDKRDLKPRLLLALINRLVFLAIFFLPLLHGVDFDTSMKPSVQFSSPEALKHKAWWTFRALFSRFERERQIYNLTYASYLVPKKIHMIWLGSPLPEFSKKMLESWRKFHPSWEVKLWTDADAKAFPMKNRNAYEAAKNYGEKSDIFRYEILETQGGLYVDSDFECLKPFDELNKLSDFYVGIAYGPAPLVYNGLIGCRPHHPVIQKCMEMLRQSSGDNSFLRILNETGPLFFSKIFKDYLKGLPRKSRYGERSFHSKQDLPLPLPITYLYPFPDNLRSAYKSYEDAKRTFVKSESFAIHYWTMSWQ